MWKRVRPTLSSALTLGRIKGMFNLVDKCAKQWLHSLPDHHEDVITVMNVKNDIMFRFTTDVIANCIFGLESDSFKQQENEFYARTERISDFGGNRIFSLFGYCFNRFIVKLFKLRVIPKKDDEFFTNVVMQTIKMRKTMGIVRPDMMHLLIEIQQGNLEKERKYAPDLKDNVAKNAEEITDLDIVGHSILFLIAGSDTSATALNFMAYELALNAEVQNRLYEEIKEVSGGNFDCDNLQRMKYLDMVVLETLRKWPPLPLTDRCSVRPHTFYLPDRTSLHLDEGSIIWIPIFSIHRDSKYYPESEQFIPERFSEENRSNINKDLYLPFGIGPRSCIGSRLAMLMMKSIMVHILFNFEIVPVKETPNQLELSKKHIFLNPDSSLRLGLKRRK